MTNPAFDLIGLTDLRNDPRYRDIDGELSDGERLVVVVIDSGIDATNPRLDDNFAAFVNFVDVGVGIPGQVITDPNQTFDFNSHGTHVAGTVGAEDPDIGVATGVDLIALQVGLAGPNNPSRLIDINATLSLIHI